MNSTELKQWLKEHDNKISIKQIKELGLIEDEKLDKVWHTDDKKMIIVGNDVEDEDSIREITEVNPIIEPQIPKTEEVIKRMEKWLDTQHYETPVGISNKPFYDKFYNHKGRKRWQR